MDIASILVVFFCSWWVIFLMVLPFGVERDLSGPQITAHGAPKKPDLKKKIWITSALTCVFTIAFYFVSQLHVFDFHAMAEQMAREDYGP